MRTFYDVLGVRRGASAVELRRAYRASVRRTHPDTGGDQAAFLEVHRAWQTLGDAGRRASYDRWLLGEAPVPEPEVPWRRPSTGMPPARLTVLGPVVLSGLMLTAVLTMVGPVPAVVGAGYVLLTALGVARAAHPGLRERVRWPGAQTTTLLRVGSWVLAASCTALAVLAASTDRSPTTPLLVAMCLIVFATATTAAGYVQTAAD